MASHCIQNKLNVCELHHMPPASLPAILSLSLCAQLPFTFFENFFGAFCTSRSKLFSSWLLLIL